MHPSPTPTSPGPRRPAARRGRALALGLCLALTGATASAQAATVPETLETPAATVTEALARDLGLDASGAERLMDAQRKALEVHEAAALAAGEAYADALFDTETLTLTVLVTDASAVAAVEDAGAQARLVGDGPATTVAALERTPLPEGVTGWYPDTDRGLVVVEALDPTAADTLLEEAGVTPDAVRVVEVDYSPVPYSEIIGGHPFHVGAARCVIGFSAVDSSGRGGFVTAGHCGAVGATAHDTEGDVLGVFEHSQFPGSDGAFVPVGPEWTLTPWVERWGSDSYLTVTGSAAAPIGSAVCASAPVLGWRCGTLQARGQSISYPEGTVQNLTRSTLCAAPGESGAPVVAGSQAQGVVSGGSGTPETGCVTFHQELDPLLNSWGLTLVTG